MKTALEILSIRLPDLRIGQKDFVSLIDAMKEYAEQAIDQCANEAETEEGGVNPYEPYYVVNRDSILAVKDQLK